MLRKGSCQANVMVMCPLASSLDGAEDTDNILLPDFPFTLQIPLGSQAFSSDKVQASCNFIGYTHVLITPPNDYTWSPCLESGWVKVSLAAHLYFTGQGWGEILFSTCWFIFVFSTKGSWLSKIKSPKSLTKSETSIWKDSEWTGSREVENPVFCLQTWDPPEELAVGTIHCQF